MRLSGQFQFFLPKNFKQTKTQSNQKATNKTKTSRQKATKATVFCTQKRLRGRKLSVLCFLKNWNCPDNLIYYTTDVYLYQPIYQEFIPMHIFWFAIICKNPLFLWKSLFYDHLWESLFYDHLWEFIFLVFMRISQCMNTVV